MASNTARLQIELDEVRGDLKNLRLTEKNAAKTALELERKMKAKTLEVRELFSVY